MNVLDLDNTTDYVFVVTIDAGDRRAYTCEQLSRMIRSRASRVTDLFPPPSAPAVRTAPQQDVKKKKTTADDITRPLEHSNGNDSSLFRIGQKLRYVRTEAFSLIVQSELKSLLISLYDARDIHAYHNSQAGLRLRALLANRHTTLELKATINEFLRRFPHVLRPRATSPAQARMTAVYRGDQYDAVQSNLTPIREGAPCP